jgi:hypothetical protein
VNETSLSLLGRLRHSPESESWNRLVHLYAPLLRVWLRKLKYVPLRADFTHPSEEIEGFLRGVGGRPGEATIVVFHGPEDEAPIVLQVKNATKSISAEDLLDAMKFKGKAKVRQNKTSKRGNVVPTVKDN